MTSSALERVGLRSVTASFGQALVAISLSVLVGLLVLYASFSALQRDVARDAAVSVLAGEAQALAARAASQNPADPAFGSGLALSQSQTWQVIRSDTRERVAASGLAEPLGALLPSDKGLFDRAG